MRLLAAYQDADRAPGRRGPSWRAAVCCAASARSDRPAVSPRPNGEVGARSRVPARCRCPRGRESDERRTLVVASWLLRAHRRQLPQRLHLPAAARQSVVVAGVALHRRAGACSRGTRTCRCVSWLVLRRPLPHLPGADQRPVSDRRGRDRRAVRRGVSTGTAPTPLGVVRIAVRLRDDRALRHRPPAPHPAQRHHRARQVSACVSACSCRPAGVSSLIGVLVGGGVLLRDRRGLLPAARRRGAGHGRREDAGDDRRVPRLAAGAGDARLASFGGAVVGVALLATGRGGMQAALPFGTFLAVGAAGRGRGRRQLVTWYSRFYR